jgi:hypothetical protein
LISACSAAETTNPDPGVGAATNVSDVQTLPPTAGARAGSATAGSRASTTPPASAAGRVAPARADAAAQPDGVATGAAGAAGAKAAGQAAGAGAQPAAGSGGTSTGTASVRELPPLDCGKDGIVIENAGPPKNRVNYAILGDGYTTAQVDTFKEHLEVAMKKRFSEVIGQPYGRYRKFVNICGIPLPSQSGPIGTGSTVLSCSGDDQSRLARCDERKASEELAARLPDSFELDWKAVVLNNDRWWNTGAVLMLWSGGHEDAAGAALHEGGHGFHQLADEYDGTNGGCEREYEEVNSTADSMMTAGKWDMWLGYDQAGATGMQTTLAGSRYCRAGQYRPSDNSMMNMLFGNDPDTSYNSVSREKMIMDFWRAVTPIDETVPKEGDAGSATSLEVFVIDPEVVSVDWSVDDKMVASNGGTRFDLAAQGLAPGGHTVTAKAYDNAGPELVRYTTGTKYGRMNWARSQQTVKWTVTVP